MIDIMAILAILCVSGILLECFPLGIIFIISLVIVIWAAISVIQKDKLNQTGIIVAIVGILALAYTVCELFLHIDLRTILEIDALLAL